MRKGDLFIFAEEMHRVGAGDRAATQGMHADFSSGALTAHAFAAIHHVAGILGIHGREQQLRGAARRVDLLIVMGLDDFDIETGQRFCGLSGETAQHRHAKRVIRAMDDGRFLAERANATHFGFVVTGGAAHKRRTRAIHISLDQVEHTLMREINRDIGRGGGVGKLILVVDADNARKFERFIGFNKLANDGSHTAIADNKYFGHIRSSSTLKHGGRPR